MSHQTPPPQRLSSPAPQGFVDQGLLAAAPSVTKADKQAGYSIDLLKAPPQSSRTPAPPTSPSQYTPVPVTAPPLPGASSSSVNEKNGFIAGAPVTTSKKVPFYRTKKGKIFIGLGVFLIIALIIGVAVGVTVGRNNKSDNGETSPAATQDPNTPLSPTTTTNTQNAPAGSNTGGNIVPTPTNSLGGDAGGGETPSEPVAPGDPGDSGLIPFDGSSGDTFAADNEESQNIRGPVLAIGASR